MHLRPSCRLSPAGQGGTNQGATDCQPCNGSGLKRLCACVRSASSGYISNAHLILRWCIYEAMQLCREQHQRECAPQAGNCRRRELTHGAAKAGTHGTGVQTREIAEERHVLHFHRMLARIRMPPCDGLRGLGMQVCVFLMLQTHGQHVVWCMVVSARNATRCGTVLSPKVAPMPPCTVLLTMCASGRANADMPLRVRCSFMAGHHPDWARCAHLMRLEQVKLFDRIPAPAAPVQSSAM